MACLRCCIVEGKGISWMRLSHARPARLAAVTAILVSAGQVAFVDLDDTVRASYGYAKQGARRGYTGIKAHIKASRRCWPQSVRRCRLRSLRRGDCARQDLPQNWTRP
jgi:hypothetical protein